MAITNDEALVRALKEPLKQAVDYVVQKIWNENREQIEQIIYRANTPQDYQRTEEFKNAWSTLATAKTGIGGATVEGSFYYAPNEMPTATPPSASNNYMGQHYGVGDTASSTNGDTHFRANGKMRSKAERAGGEWGDSRAYLAEIIYQGLAGPAFGDGYWRKKRDAFEALLKYIGKQRMKQWFEEGMTYAGLDYKRHGGALQVEYE